MNLYFNLASVFGLFCQFLTQNYLGNDVMIWRIFQPFSMCVGYNPFLAFETFQNFYFWMRQILVRIFGALKCCQKQFLSFAFYMSVSAWQKADSLSKSILQDIKSKWGEVKILKELKKCSFWSQFYLTSFILRSWTLGKKFRLFYGQFCSL